MANLALVYAVPSRRRLVRLPLAYVFGVFLAGGLWAAWLAMFGDFVLRSILAAIRFARGRWISLKV